MTYVCYPRMNEIDRKKKQSDARMACTSANQYISDTTPSRYRIPELKSTQSDWLEQHLQHYTDPYIGRISGLSAMMERQ